jgi:hypothetical protein
MKMPYTEVVSIFQRSLFWKMSLKKITRNAIIVDDGFIEALLERATDDSRQKHQEI